MTIVQSAIAIDCIIGGPDWVVAEEGGQAHVAAASSLANA